MWLIWLAVALLAVIGEMMTTGLFLASIALAAGLTALVSLLLPVVAFQVGIFAIVSLFGIAVFRPIVVHALGMDVARQLTGPILQTHMAGRRGVVTQAIDASGGQIRVGQGEFWSARSYTPGTTIPAGQPVEIVLVDGLTALVEPVDAPASLEAPNETAQKGT